MPNGGRLWFVAGTFDLCASSGMLCFNINLESIPSIPPKTQNTSISWMPVFRTSASLCTKRHHLLPSFNATGSEPEWLEKEKGELADGTAAQTPKRPKKRKSIQKAPKKDPEDSQLQGRAPPPWCQMVAEGLHEIRRIHARSSSGVRTGALCERALFRT